MKSNGKSWALWGAGMGVAAAVAGAAFYLELPRGAQATEAASQAAPPAIPVTVAAVEPRDVTSWQEFSGRLEAIDRVEIRPRVAGAIQSVHFREGALVKQGDLLVTIDPAPYEAAVAQAQAQVGAAKATLNLTKVEVDRGQKLFDNKTISQSDMDTRASNYAAAEANLKAAQATLQTAQLNLDYTQVRAPIAGRVGKIAVTVGNLVAAGASSSVLTTLVSVDPIYASFSANEQTVTQALSELPATGGIVPPVEQIPVQIGTASDNGTPIKGKLQLIDNEVDAASGTVSVRAVFDNPGGRLIPGQFVRVRMGQPKAENKIVIDDRAVGTDQDKKFVFVVDGENKVNYRQVQLGSVVDGQRVIENGLKAGEKIVVNGLQRIRPGAVVAPQLAEKVATAQ
ncbi:MexE family multidrug efflux RND transporter periplasmic adaptor subunit [Rhizobium dioscoreae]|uniref:MexE family multidrug efflux RND transporter periplasmic adaptor subunit n=1 Tax=Rhizobium dioscoreae TaxID=2653122 RepID=A0ABQ0YXF9_9HYPH|nr:MULTISPECIES: efflux RND transporter periplasmic adaptor subunit [Rhizobium]TWB17723.1 multidrug efflux system membrane fusion protein [Rhizobium sp. ERR1071]GES44384.1 MexE family multidrug efflux RND transporter periplasmic adaptor subunit [Rhizobium dioscoreae]GES47785.1 MexE family multidrug efflux RND transporter periplasmic adaptor subunit [Rhizobium dioscoreae]GLU79748.1 MexE family multidrug efflux RND transporter periplasmic adaptor subunit [Rhizobium sp. NBRC 114257]